MENVAYEHRQRILREEERLRNYKTEVQQQLDGRQVRRGCSSRGPGPLVLVVPGCAYTL